MPIFRLVKTQNFRRFPGPKSAPNSWKEPSNSRISKILLKIRLQLKYRRHLKSMDHRGRFFFCTYRFCEFAPELLWVIVFPTVLWHHFPKDHLKSKVWFSATTTKSSSYRQARLVSFGVREAYAWEITPTSQTSMDWTFTYSDSIRLKWERDQSGLGIG